MNVYETLPVFEGENFILRGVLPADTEHLLKVYSDEKAVPFFNSDNCHGDDFHYTTYARMKEAVDFWLWSYKQGYFVRWAIVDKKTNSAIGTIELFHRDGEQTEYDKCGLLRLDISSEFERYAPITEILSLIAEPAYDLFYCDKITTKVKPFAEERLKAVKALGFKPAKEPLTGNDGEKFTDYYVLYK